MALLFYRLKVKLVIGRTRVARKDLAEVVVPRRRSSTQSSVRDIQQGAIFLVLMEVVAASWDVVAEPPGTGTVRITNAKERVEGSGYAIVGRW